MFFGIKLYPARIIFAAFTIACMIVIFMFSCDNAKKSSSKSGKVTETAVEMFFKDYDKLPKSKQVSIMDKAEHIIRKLAHYSIYTALGFCASMTVGKRRLKSPKNAGVIIFCFLYACSDEFHQRFTPGRSCMFTDVLIDTSGALTGMLMSLVLLAVIGWISRRHKQNRELRAKNAGTPV